MIESFFSVGWDNYRTSKNFGAEHLWATSIDFSMSKKEWKISESEVRIIADSKNCSDNQKSIRTGILNYCYIASLNTHQIDNW